jgi:hypothetical protein
MSKRALLLSALTGITATVAIVGMLIVSLRTGVAPVTIPVFALVLGPALAAAAMVATCSMVAPPPRPQPVLHAVEIRPAHLEEPVESVVRMQR